MGFTLGLLQLETILSILLFRSSILGMLNLYKKNVQTDLNKERMQLKKNNLRRTEKKGVCESHSFYPPLLL